MRTQASQSGFTLLEIIIVMALTGLIVTIGIITMGDTMRDAALDSSTATVITALDTARNRSMHGFGDGSGEQFVEVSADGKSIVTNSGTITLSPTVAIDATGERITFGRISGSTTPRTLVLSDNQGNTATITVSSHGYVREE